METTYRVAKKATNFGSKPAEPKTNCCDKKFIKFKSFYDPSKQTHNPKRIYFAIEITQNMLTKSI